MAQLQIKRDVIMIKCNSKQDIIKCLSVGAGNKLFDDVYEFKHGQIMRILDTFYSISSIVELQQAIDLGKFPKILFDIASKYNVEYSMTEQLKVQGPATSTDSFLFKHQQLCRQIALINPRYGFFLETGTGKTPLGLQIVVDDLVVNPTHRWLLICPLSLINMAWIEDKNKFFPYLQMQSLHGNTPAQTKKAYKTPANLYVINYESFKINYDVLLQFGFEGMILDESSKIKSMSSGVTKAVHKFAKTVNRYYELTGTPAPNSMLEYFSQMYPIDSTLLGTSFTSFKAKWFYSYKAGQFDKFDILPEKKEELINIIKQKAIFIAKKDCLDLPPIMPDMIREIAMPIDLSKLYKQMKNELYTEICEQLTEEYAEHKVILAANTVTSLGKLNQLTSGFIIDEDKVIHRVSDAKLKVLEEVLEEIGPKQTIIWANYKGDFTMISELLGDKAVYYYGGTNPTDIQRLCIKHYGDGAFEKFKDEGLTPKDIAAKLFKEGKVQYFVGNPQSAAYGLTFTNSSTTIYFGLNYSYEQHSQSRDRTNRYGQKESCIYIYLLMKGTIDYALYKCIRDKGDLLYSVLEHLKPESIGGDF